LALITLPPKSPLELISCQAMWLHLFHKDREKMCIL
jgi:hypothetical protein